MEKVIGYSVMDSIALGRMRYVDDEDYTYDKHVIPNKNGGVTVVTAEPLAPYPERNDARVASLESRIFELEERISALANTQCWLVEKVGEQERIIAALEDAVVEHDKQLEILTAIVEAYNGRVGTGS